MRKFLAMLYGVLLAGICLAQNEESQLSKVEDLEKRMQTVESSLLSLKKLKVSGYIQTQYQRGDKDAKLKVGSANSKPEDSFNRIGIRRGRIKFTYTENIASGVFQLDITENGVSVKDAYLNISDPWMRSCILQAGVFNRPFGHEIGYSSSRRESPERSTIIQTLFPEERDLGAMLVLQAPKTSPWNMFKLEAGLFAGNGIKKETDNKKDFIGHLSATKPIGNEGCWGLGMSYYNGSVFQGDTKVFTMKNKTFVLDDKPENQGKFAKRKYIGFDAQFSVISNFGLSQIRTEYIFGKQPGTGKSSKSPNSSTQVIDNTYIRSFRGGYVIVTQDLGTLPLSAVFKYDWYDPNIKVAGNDIGKNGTSATDIKLNTFGLGLLWRVNNNIKIQAYYDINRNEKTENIDKYKTDLKDNAFTLRLQYKF